MTRRRRRSDRSGRPPLFSPGRPVVAGRDEQRRFWAAIAAAWRVRMRHSKLVCRGLWEHDCSERQAACHQRCFGDQRSRRPGGISHLRSGRRSPFFAFKAAPRGRLRAGSDEPLLQSRGSCGANAATRSGDLAYRATTAQWHAERSARRPKRAKLALNAALRTLCGTTMAGVVVAPGGASVSGPAVGWKGRRHGPRKPRRVGKRWSPEQIARRLPVDFRTMRPCASAMKRSIKRCSFKVVARCAAS